jgi:Flp pilus assembly protein TadG
MIVDNKRRRRSGSAIVELSLLLPVLVSLFLGVWQFGYGFYTYNELEQAVRAGARYASMRAYDSATETPSTAFRDAVRNVVVYGTPAVGTTPVVPNLTTANVNVTAAFASKVPRYVTVSITNYQIPLFLGDVTLNGRPATRFPYVGVYEP